MRRGWGGGRGSPNHSSPWYDILDICMSSEAYPSSAVEGGEDRGWLRRLVSGIISQVPLTQASDDQLLPRQLLRCFFSGWLTSQSLISCHQTNAPLRTELTFLRQVPQISLQSFCWCLWLSASSGSAILSVQVTTRIWKLKDNAPPHLPPPRSLPRLCLLLWSLWSQRD